MARPRPTVRQRFTLLFAALLLVSAMGMLVLTNLFVGPVSESVPAPYPPGGQAAQERIARLEAELADVPRQLLTGSLLALAVMAAVAVLAGRLVAGRVLRPLRTITAATRRITAVNLHERLAVPGPVDEVKDLADTIDGLLERLEASFAAQRRFVADASHELRTPLTTMRASLDVAAAKPEAAPQTLALAGRLRTELDRVDHLLEGLLVLARAQHGALPDHAPVDLAAVVAAAVAARRTEIAAKGLTVHHEDAGQGDSAGEVALIDGSPTLLARLVDNLVDNAIVHNESGGWIRVGVPVERTAARLVVATGGPVLDPQRVAELTRPFHRLAAARTASRTGVGLGLSIVSAIADAHGGCLELHARSEGGLRATVVLPVASARTEAGR